MQLPEDFKKFIELMISSSVRFVMIGGFAYNLYRNPRATGDINFLVASDADNESLLRSIREEFGFGEALTSDRLLVEGKVVMLGRSPFRIYLLTTISGLSFQEVEDSAQIHEIDGMQVPVISPQLLLRNKVAAGRAKDLADAEELTAWLDSRNEA